MSELRGRALWVVAGGLVCQMGLGCSYAFGPLLKDITGDLGWSRAEFAAGRAPLLLVIAFASPVVGAAAARLGARSVLVTSALLLGVALGGMSAMQSFWHFLALNLVLGLVIAGLGDVAVGSVVARWFERSRGLALGVVYVGSNLGGVIAVPAAALIAETSWRLALLAVGIGGMAVILPFALWAVREPRGAEQPGAAPGEPRPAEVGGVGLPQALRTRTFWILGVVLFSFYFYYLGVNEHLVAFLTDEGVSNARAAAGLSFAIGLGIGSKIGFGLLADRIARKTALLANFAALTAGSLLLLAVPAPGFLAAFLVVHGFATAAQNVIYPLIVADCFGARYMAEIYGALMIALLPGGVLGPVFAGYVFDSLGGYGPAFATFALLNAGALAALAWVRREEPALAGAPLAGVA